MKKILIISNIALISFLFLINMAFAGSATISWNANTEEDLAGYRIYYGTTKGGPYGSSTALIPKAQTSYTLSNLSDGTYYFVVVALDTADNESAYSSEVTKTIASTTAATTPTTTVSTTTTTTTQTPVEPTTTAASAPTTPAQSTTTSSSGAVERAPMGTASSPIPLPASGIYGNVSDSANQLQEVNFTFPSKFNKKGKLQKVKVYYAGFDINSNGEVSILVNGSTVGYVKKTKFVKKTNQPKWSGTKKITIKAAYMNGSTDNVLTFRNVDSTNQWAVRSISVR